MSPEEARRRFLSKIKVSETGCWEWQGYIQPNGYGYFRLFPQTNWAHRASYLLLRGPIPEGLVIDHLCRNKPCVNPDHLEVVTQQENVMRAKPWTKCPEYHPADPSRFVERGDGRSYCRECNRVREQQRRDRRAAATLPGERLTHAR